MLDSIGSPRSRGGQGAINMRATPKIGKVASIQLVDDSAEMMVISQFGKIIRIDTKQVRAKPALSKAERGRAIMGAKLLGLDQDDKVAAAMVIPRRPQTHHRKRSVAAVRRHHG